jgi:hypothetical protein
MKIMKWIKMSIVKLIQRECLAGKTPVFDAVNQIDQAIGGITSVVFKTGKTFKIVNHDAMFALNVNGVKKKALDRLYGLAAVAYAKAQKNGSMQPGEVHISNQASTKHYKAGIQSLLQKYAPAYAR